MPFIESALIESKLTDDKMVAAIIATATYETNSFRSNVEAASGAAYEGSNALGNTQVGDGERFKGRGLIYTTGRADYLRYSKELGLGDLLVDSPDDVNKPEIASRILCRFFKDKPAIASALAESDLARVRRYVNGGLEGLKPFTELYEKVLAALNTAQPTTTSSSQKR
jgi:predicted chitinase